MAKRRKRARRRLRRPRLPRFNLRKAMFVLPNLFTLSGIFCGFYAIILAGDDPTPERLYRASLAVFFGLFFDMADGRVARLTRTQSEFGVQIDSLSDLVTFGVAPAVIVHQWALREFGLLGAVAAFAFVACGAIRLARFNILARRGGSSTDFIGLPIPLAAGVMISLVMFHQRTFAAPVTHEGSVVVLLLVLAYLMVSNVRYRSFKKVRPSPKAFALLAVVTAAVIAMALLVAPLFAVFSFFCAYVGMGLIEEVIFFRRRRREDAARKTPSEPDQRDAASASGGGET
jgi:CDP-diacylglycerol--serine O-phosphatidyltransferase